MVIAELVTELVGDDSSLRQSLDSSLGQARGWASSLGGIATAGVGLIAAGGVAAAGALAAVGAVAFDMASDVNQAQSMIQVGLGTTAEEAQRLGDVAVDVFANNFGESIGEAADAVVEVSRRLGDLGVTADEDIQAVAESAFMLRDAFGLEVPESLSAVQTLMSEFGLSSQEALDFVTSGFQNIPAFAEDGLDTIGEYAGLFADAGFRAEEMFSIMETGAAGGVLATDKIADAVKEFGIIFMEGGDEVAGALEDLGMNYDGWVEGVRTGNADLSDVFGRITEKLAEIEDPIERNRLQVAIFGTAAEDLGASFTLGLDPGLRSLDEMAGATEGLNVMYDNWPAMWEGIKRQAMAALVPLGEVLLDIGNQIMPLVQEGFAWFETTLVPLIEDVSAIFGDFFEGIMSGEDPVGDLANLGYELALAFGATQEQATAVWTRLRELGDTLLEAAARVQEFLAPIIDAVLQFVSWKDILLVVAGVVGGVVIGAIVSLVSAIAPVLLAVGAAVAIVAVLRNAWESNFLGIRDFVQNAIATISTVIQTALANIQAWWAANGASIIASAQNAWNTIQTAVQTVISVVQNIIQTALNTIQTWWTQHGDSVMTIVNAFLSFVRDGIMRDIQNIQQFIQSALAAINQFWDTHGATIINIVLDMWNAIKNEIQSALDFVGGIIDAFALLVQGDWEGFWSTIWDTVVDRWNAIQESISTATGTIREVIDGLIQDIISFFQNTDWGALGRRILDGILQALQNGAGAIMDFLAQLAQDIIGGILDFFTGGAGAQSLPSFGPNGLLPAGGGTTVNNYHLTLHSQESTGRVADDFYLMEAAAL